MKFTAVVPVTTEVKKEFEIYVSDDNQKILKAYETWYDDMSDENAQAFIKTCAEVYEDEPEDWSLDYAKDTVNDILWDVQNEIHCRANTCDVDDVHAIADGDFNFSD